MPFSEQAELQSWQGVTFPMNEDVAVMDIKTGNIVPRDGVTQGEVVIRGNTVMKGYYKNQKANQEAMRNGWFYSAMLPSGMNKGVYSNQRPVERCHYFGW
ncbi:MAG: hypothetical protein CM15mP95_2420 [Alphaproteobacteria bacterium]|nr:MAG: hypothetical protein CM15mP95_2420 [Alphaproteobacteria bacterium]